MNLAAPTSVLLSTTDARVLAVLSGTTEGLSGREVAQLAEMAHGTVWRALRRFVEHGLVDEQAAGGRTHLYRLNRDHVAADAVIALGRLRVTLVDRIREHLLQWQTPPVHAWLFGSMARGQGDTSSDIDILLVRPEGIAEDDPTWNEQVADLASAIHRWSGNVAGIADIHAEDIQRMRRERPAIVDDVVRDGVTLVGDRAASALGSTT